MQAAKTTDLSTDAIQDSTLIQSNVRHSARPGIPLGLGLGVLFGVSIVYFSVLNGLFPVFRIADQLLKQFPPEGVASVRETAFARCRLTNSLLAIATCSFATGLLLPSSLILIKRIERSALAYLIPGAVGSALLACVGVGLAHCVMEFTSSTSLGITKTFLTHWIEFGFFGAGIGVAVGIALSDVNGAVQRGLVTGLISATLFDLISVVMPQTRLDSLIPGGVLWGSHDSTVIAMWVGFLLLPLGIGMQKLGVKQPK